MLKTSIGAQGG